MLLCYNITMDEKEKNTFYIKEKEILKFCTLFSVARIIFFYVFAQSVCIYLLMEAWRVQNNFPDFSTEKLYSKEFNLNCVA